MAGSGRNLTGEDVEQFPVGDIAPEDISELPALFKKLMKDYNKNSIIRARQDAEFQEFRPSLSKPIIDELDAEVGAAYGFSEAEIDYLVNYEVKYRLGAAETRAQASLRNSDRTACESVRIRGTR